MTSTMLRTTHASLITACVGAMILAACRPAQPANDTTAQRAADSQSLVTPPQLGTVSAKPTTSATGKQIGPSRPTAGTSTGSKPIATIPPKARRGETAAAETLSVASFLDRSLNAGQHVQITGTCLDQFHTRGSAGPPPVSRSDWQLSGGTQVVYVVGRMPLACSAGPLTLAGTVGVDTTVILGRSTARRFLVIAH